MIPDINRLRDALLTVDSIADTNLSEIAAIATLCLRALETPAGCSDLESIAMAFSAIASKAYAANEMIGQEAVDVGCTNVHDDADRRFSARQAAREQERRRAPQ
jgi:hypothetical protein